MEEFKGIDEELAELEKHKPNKTTEDDTDIEELERDIKGLSDDPELKELKRLQEELKTLE